MEEEEPIARVAGRVILLLDKLLTQRIWYALFSQFQVNMENFCRRFPLVSKMVFNELDDQSLTKVKMSNREICQYLDEERFYWIRVLKSFRGRIGEFNESWKKVVNKAPTEIIQQFAIACRNFFEHHEEQTNIRDGKEGVCRQPFDAWSMILCTNILPLIQSIPTPFF